MSRVPPPAVSPLRPSDHAFWVTSLPTAAYAYGLRQELVMGMELDLPDADLKRLVNSLGAYLRIRGEVPTAIDLYRIVQASCGVRAWPLCETVAKRIEAFATMRSELFAKDLELWTNPDLAAPQTA